MHAWLNARASANECLPSSPYMRGLQILMDTSRPQTHASLGRCTQGFLEKGGLTKPPPFTPWLEAKAFVDLDGIAFQIWYPIGKSAARIFLYNDNL